MKKYLKLFVFPVMFILIFLIAKILLYVFNLEFMSWVYYVFITVISVCLLFIINYILINQRKSQKKIDMFDIAGANLVMITVYGIIILVLAVTVGTDYPYKNKDVVFQRTFIDFRPNKYFFEYVNFIVRGNKKISCIGEVCD